MPFVEVFSFRFHCGSIVPSHCPIVWCGVYKYSYSLHLDSKLAIQCFASCWQSEKNITFLECVIVYMDLCPLERGCPYKWGSTCPLVVLFLEVLSLWEVGLQLVLWLSSSWRYYLYGKWDCNLSSGCPLLGGTMGSGIATCPLFRGCPLFRASTVGGSTVRITKPFYSACYQLQPCTCFFSFLVQFRLTRTCCRALPHRHHALSAVLVSGTTCLRPSLALWHHYGKGVCWQRGRSVLQGCVTFTPPPDMKMG